jgi:hypothetical protein
MPVPLPRPRDSDFSEKASAFPKNSRAARRRGPEISAPPDLAAKAGRMWAIPGNAPIIRPLSGLKRGGKNFFEKNFPVVFQKVII